MNHSLDFIEDSALKYLFSAVLLRQAYSISVTSLQRSHALRVALQLKLGHTLLTGVSVTAASVPAVISFIVWMCLFVISTF